MQSFDRTDDRAVESALTLLKQTPVSDFVSQGMFESVFEIRKQACLVEELRGLKPTEAEAKFFLRLIRDRLEKREWNILPNNGGGLEKPLLFRREAVNARSQYCLNCRWHRRALHCFLQSITPSLAH